MKNSNANVEDHGFLWIDLIDPTTEELDQLVDEFKLHPALVKDSLQPNHLPKYERMESYSFAIFRIHTKNKVAEANSVQELTHKIAIFYSKEFIITIHRGKHDFFNDLLKIVQAKGVYPKCGAPELVDLHVLEHL